LSTLTRNRPALIQMNSRLLPAIVGAGALYAAALVLAHVYYRRVLYPAAGGAWAASRQRANLATLDDASLLTCIASDDKEVHALEFTNPTAKRTIVHFHGNGEVVGDDAWFARELVRRGFSVLLAEYRGYGVSAPGEPTEEGLYADAEAVLGALAARGIGKDRVVLWGISLGTGVATEMAKRGRGAALVLVAPYTSILDVARRYVPFLPVRLVMGDRFENLAKASSLHVPTLIFHGTRDAVVPFAMGKKLAGAIEGATFVPVVGGQHTDLFSGPHEHHFEVARSFIDASLAPTAR
jgi:uncharacterized protein